MVKWKKVIPRASKTPPLKGPIRKNATVSHPNTPHPTDDNDNNEEVSSLAEDSSDEAQGPEVDATSIDRQDPLLVLAFSLVPIIE